MRSFKSSENTVTFGAPNALLKQELKRIKKFPKKSRRRDPFNLGKPVENLCCLTMSNIWAFLKIDYLTNAASHFA